MATVTIRNLPDELHERVRRRAAENGRSLQAELRQALAQVYPPERSEVEGGERPDYVARVHRLQEAFRHLRRPGRSLVDELIAERRWEAACEDAEAEGRPRPSRSDYVKDD